LKQVYQPVFRQCADGSLWHPPMPEQTLVQRKVTWCERVRYLGLFWGSEKPFASCTFELFEAGRRAFYALCHRLDVCKIWAPAARLKCFDVQVRSVLSYGAELWGPDKLVELFRLAPGQRKIKESPFDLALRDPMVSLQKQFLTRCVGVRAPPMRLLFRELSQLPLHCFWFGLALSFWNRLVAAEGTVYHDTFCDDVGLALVRRLDVDCWAAKMLLVLNFLGYKWPGVDGVGRYTTHTIQIDDALCALQAKFEVDWVAHSMPCDPRSYVGPGVTMCRYENWMGAPVVNAPVEPGNPCCYLHDYMSLGHVHATARLRLCAWPLEVYRGTSRDRCDRKCRVCNSGQTEDEYHVIFECAAYTTLRIESGLDLSVGDMKAFMANTPRAVGSFLYKVQQHRLCVLDLTAR
jgi:hypothetical protein